MFYQNTSSYFVKYARIQVYSDRYFPVLVQNLKFHNLWEKMRVRENQYSSIFYVVSDLTKGRRGSYQTLIRNLKKPNKYIIAWKVSVFRVFLVRIFPYLCWIRRFESPYSVRIWENTDQKNSECAQCSCSAYLLERRFYLTHFSLIFHFYTKWNILLREVKMKLWKRWDLLVRGVI